MVLFAGSHFHAGVSVLWLPQNYVSDMDGGFRFFSLSFPSAILYIMHFYGEGGLVLINFSLHIFYILFFILFSSLSELYLYISVSFF